MLIPIMGLCFCALLLSAALVLVHWRSRRSWNLLRVAGLLLGVSLGVFVGAWGGGALLSHLTSGAGLGAGNFFLWASTIGASTAGFGWVGWRLGAALER